MAIVKYLENINCPFMNKTIFLVYICTRNEIYHYKASARTPKGSRQYFGECWIS